jgi:hypothetical protein
MENEYECAEYGICPHTIGVVYDTQLYHGGAIGDLESDSEFDLNIDVGDESAPPSAGEDSDEESAAEGRSAQSEVEKEDESFIVSRTASTAPVQKQDKDSDPTRASPRHKHPHKRAKKEKTVIGGVHMTPFTSIVRDFDNFLKSARLPL